MSRILLIEGEKNRTEKRENEEAMRRRQDRSEKAQNLPAAWSSDGQIVRARLREHGEQGLRKVNVDYGKVSGHSKIGQRAEYEGREC